MKRKKNTGTALIAAALALCVLFSGTILFSRLAQFAQAEPCHYIPLTRASGRTHISSANTKLFRPGDPQFLAYAPADWFKVWDKDTVWQGETDIEIFRFSYENSGGQVTVSSQTGDKLLAPGTSNTYTFALENTANFPVSYEMSMQAYFSDGEHVIPVVVKVSDHNGTYLAGSQESYADVLELNNVGDSGALKEGYCMYYTLEWEWPMDGDDEYDTLLGNLAQDEDITLTIVINTTASFTEEEGGGEPPKTGDRSLGPAFAAMAVSAIALIILLPMRKGDEDEED